MNEYSIAGFSLNCASFPFWFFPPWNRYRCLPHESLRHFFASGNRTRPVKREFRFRNRVREAGGETI
jgi:hypothetical protein